MLCRDVIAVSSSLVDPLPTFDMSGGLKRRIDPIKASGGQTFMSYPDLEQAI